MGILETIYKRAKLRHGKIAFPEARDIRVLRAVSVLARKKLVVPVLVGGRQEIVKIAGKHGLDLCGVEIVDVNKAADLREFAALYYSKRKHRGMSLAEAAKTVKNPLFYAAMLTAKAEVDGYVAGAVFTSGDVARSALHCIGVDPSIKTLSSSFVMIFKDRNLGADGVFVFADCGIVPAPTAAQLAQIAVSSADLFKKVFNLEPVVALLSYSTKGSAKGELIDKVSKAAVIAAKMRPSLKIDGELQADAAIIPEVACLKAPGSRLEGKANVLIFPGLEAGNIAYKLVQRFSKARAIGPLLQGLKRPCSDLSRGCSSQDIIDAAAITALRSSKK